MSRSLPPANSKGQPSSQHPCSGPYANGVFLQEAIKRLPDVCKAIVVRWGKVSSDEVCPLYSVDNFTAHHV